MNIVSSADAVVTANKIKDINNTDIYVLNPHFNKLSFGLFVSSSIFIH
jgi:hypothetical protein